MEIKEKRVSATEFTKNFGKYKEESRQRDLIITWYNREILAVIHIDEYWRLKAMDNRRAYGVNDVPDDQRAEPLKSAKDMQKE